MAGNKKKTVELGPLPVAKINKAVCLELEPGDTVFTGHAQKHAQRRHPDDFDRCLPHVGQVIADPAYIGDDFRNSGKIELIRMIPALKGDALLVAVIIEPDHEGRYHVASMYPISQRDVDIRRAKGYLRNAPLK